MRSCPTPLVLLAATLALSAATLAVLPPAAAQQPPAPAAPPRQLTPADYARAESFLSYSVAPLVDHTVSDPTWIAGDRVWFRDRSAAGTTWQLADPAHHSLHPAFDNAALARAIAAANPGKPAPDPSHLPLQDVSLTPDAVDFTIHDTALHCTLAARTGSQPVCSPQTASTTPAAPARRRRPSADAVVSPDGTRAAFIRDWNLWLRDIHTGAETRLTHDGVEDFGYATDNAGWTHSDRAILVWSPDSKKIATFQQDQRKTGEMYLVPVTNSHPKLEAWKYPLVGDKDVTLIERVILDLSTATPTTIRLKMPPDQHRSSICDDVSCSGGWDDVQWAPDASHLAFVSTSRDHRDEWLRLADARTGDVREVFHESAPKFFESGDERVNWHYLPASNEFLWFSERSGWGEMYLYNLATGQLKNPITTGDGNVKEVLSVDEQSRTLLFLGVGREPGLDPYFVQLYSVGFDGKNLKRLTPGDTNHAVTLSPDAHLFVDVSSTPTEPQTTVIRDRDGRELLPLAHQDITRLKAAGWKPLTPVTVKARDGSTDLYGFLFTPTTMEPGRRYPIVNYVYPGPQTGSCGSRAFSPSHGDNQALAELGFVVVCIDGMGTNLRSKAFHEAYFGDLGDNTIPDQVTGIEQLARRLPFIDLTRVGIWGHSGGGNATAAALLHHPDFFSVGIAESGNHDQRDYEDDWAEKWAGLEVNNPDGTSNYDSQANANFAKNLKGHLLLAHGTMDDNVPPNNTLLLVDALIKANKTFDLLMIPNAHHGYGAAGPYMMRRRWDYFVRCLAGNLPPDNYQLKSTAETQAILQGPAPEIDQDLE